MKSDLINEVNIGGQIGGSGTIDPSGPIVVQRYISSMALVHHLLSSGQTAAFRQYLFDFARNEWERDSYLTEFEETHKAHHAAVEGQIRKFDAELKTFNTAIDTYNNDVDRYTGARSQPPRRCQVSQSFPHHSRSRKFSPLPARPESFPAMPFFREPGRSI